MPFGRERGFLHWFSFPQCTLVHAPMNMASNINLGHFYKNPSWNSSTPCTLYVTNYLIVSILFILPWGLEVVLEEGKFCPLWGEGHIKLVQFTETFNNTIFNLSKNDGITRFPVFVPSYTKEGHASEGKWGEDMNMTTFRSWSNNTKGANMLICDGMPLILGLYGSHLHGLKFSVGFWLILISQHLAHIWLWYKDTIIFSIILCTLYTIVLSFLDGCPTCVAPLWEVNHTIPLINLEAQYLMWTPCCSSALFPLLWEKMEHYVKVGWWVSAHGWNAVPLLSIPKAENSRP